ncbi:MAG: ribosome recycling factor [Erysipelotrichaceae bacterium]|nr:ribosome recycling factor [Erysipelotrichaceae bacterium]
MADLLNTTKEKMDKAIVYFEENLKQIRTGQANVNMLDRVEVDYYGAPTPIKQLAGLSVQEGRTIVIKPYDRSTLKEIEKAINKADIGIAPQNDGQVIRLVVPQLTQDVRKDMCKKVSKMAEEAKVQVRNIRRDVNDVCKKDKEMPEDMQKDLLDKIQKKTDEYIKKVDAIADAKQKEVMKV